MSKSELGNYFRRIAAAETALKTEAPSTALLIADTGAFASRSMALPVRGAGNPQFKSAVSGGKYSHFAAKKLQAFSHNKRGLATTGAGAAAGIGTGIAVSSTIGGGAAALGLGAIVATGAITGGIAVGALVLGIGIAVLVNMYNSHEKNAAHDRFTGKTGGDDYTGTEMMTDLKYVLSNGELEDLARFQDKAIESGKLLDAAIAAPVATCGDAATLAYAMHRHKYRLRERLAKSKAMDHIAAYKALVDNKIFAAAQMCELLGEMHTSSLIIHLSGSRDSGRNREQMHAYSKSAEPSVEIRNYVDLKWARWYDTALSGAVPAKRNHMSDLVGTLAPRLRAMNTSDRDAMKVAFAVILKEAKNSSDGDHKNVAGKMTDSLAQALLTADSATRQAKHGGGSGAGAAHVGGTSLATFATAQLQEVLMSAGKTAAGSASVSSALGASAIGSVTNIAASAGAGLAAGILVSALVGYVLEAKNDSDNVKAIYGNTVTDPARRIWLLRSMLQAGRLNTMYESYKKCQQSIAALQAFYGSRDRVSGTHAQMVEATKHLFRIQKHLLRMLAVSGVLTMFFEELDTQVDKMLAEYSIAGGAADQAVAKVKQQVQLPTHQCPGTCYHHTASGPGGLIVVANRLVGVPALV